MRDPKQVNRRVALAGAGTAGALAVAATLLPTAKSPSTQAGTPGVEPASDQGSGYRLTDHIKRYYASARI